MPLLVACRSPADGTPDARLFPPTYDGNPLVDVRTVAGHADVRLSGLWNRHVWKKGARNTRGSVY